MMTLMTIDEVSQLVRLSISTIYRLSSERKIPHVKVSGRLLFDNDRIEQWVQEQAVEVRQPLKMHREASG